MTPPDGTDLTPGDDNPDALAAEQGDPDNAPSLDELRQRARDLDIPGRSSMDADELTAAITAAEQAEAAAPPDPGTPDETGRPPLGQVAEDRAANRDVRVIGATQEA